MPRLRTYSELIQHRTFEDRFAYLSLRGEVGKETFGYDRWMNQDFYTSREWRLVRRDVIARDLGRDLAMPGYDIFDKVYVHHMNPLTADSIIHSDDGNLDPEFLITVSHRTHNAIHYGDARLLPQPVVERRPGDTKLW